jgi:DNA-binding MarR family transcriptional regulator
MMKNMIRNQLRLSETELGAWAGFLRVNAALSRDMDARLQSEHGISFSDYDVLVFLANAPDRRMRMSDISESVLISQSGITRLVDRLVARGLVEREKCSDDRRGYFAVLTDAGFAKVREASRSHMADIKERFLDVLSPAELETLADVWERVLPGTTEAISPLAGSRSG